MNILIADDDPITRKLIEHTLRRWHHTVYSAPDGSVALEMYRQNEAIEMIILDWMMPNMDGLATCTAIRDMSRTLSPFIIMLTSKVGKDFVVRALDAGADDYVTKPPDPGEMKARIAAGERVLNMQKDLHHKINLLEETVARIKQLESHIPVCPDCSTLRNDAAYWKCLNALIEDHRDRHVVLDKCPQCRQNSPVKSERPA